MPLSTYNKIPVPSFMYGTAWKKEASTKLVELAVESGFKAIDTANQIIHYDEARVGEALKKIFSKGIKREDLFIQTKFTHTTGQDHRTPYDKEADFGTQVKQSMASSLAHLHTEYLDSYVLHGPYSRYEFGAEDKEAWASMEELYEAGKTRCLGISNVSAEQLKQLLNYAKVRPMFVQNRCYAIRVWDKDVREICRENGIIYQGFSLLTANSQELSKPAISAICRRLGATPAQVIFAFCRQIGMLPLTGTTSASHMKEDLLSEGFELTENEIASIEAISLH